MEENTIQHAMEIILHAGEARTACKLALDAISEGDISSANKHLKAAQEQITVAHKVQTDAIQEETRGVKSEYSLLFAHAQDTLMTVYSEINIAKQLIKIFKNVESRLSALENK